MLFIPEGEGFDHKHELPAVVYRWGGGVLNPTTLPMPGKSDVEVTQVAIGRMSKTGVTSKGRLIIWEVRFVIIWSVCRPTCEIPNYPNLDELSKNVSLSCALRILLTSEVLPLFICNNKQLTFIIKVFTDKVVFI